MSTKLGMIETSYCLLSVTVAAMHRRGLSTKGLDFGGHYRGPSPGRSRQAIHIRAAIVRPRSPWGRFRNNGYLPISRTLFITISSVNGHFAPDDFARCTLPHRYLYL
jgi:hypothetical protein